MECNKDEAARAKEIAEQKFKMKDIAGAKKFALKAQSLYPEVEGVSQMLATFDVYFAAANKVNEDMNWYGILDASPRDDEETLKRKYRKLALLLHPDKNSSIGAEGAFKYVLDAWKFLSDKEKRAAYDRKKSLQAVYQKVSVSTSNNGFCNFGKTHFPTNASSFANPSFPTNASNFAKTSIPTNARTTTTTQQNNPNPQKPVGSTQQTGRAYHQRTATAATPSSFTASGSTVKSETSTFWTVCRRCMMQYEYPRAYVNFNLLCANCRQTFSAVEVPKPGVTKRWTSSSRLKRNLDPKSAANHSTTTSGVFDNSKWTFSRTSSAAHAASVVQQAYEKVKKDREEAKASARRDKKSSKRKSTAATDSSASGSSLKKRKVMGETDIDCSIGKKVTYYMTGETGKLQRGTKEIVDKSSTGIKKKFSKEDVTTEQHGTKEIVDKSSTGIKKKISKEDVTTEVKSSLAI